MKYLLSITFLAFIAIEPLHFASAKYLQFHQLVGGFKPMYKNVTRLGKAHPADIAKLPKEFDAREQWPECRSIIGNISQQGHCGSCWAMAATGVMSDRICIASKGNIKVHISAKDLLECCGVGPGLCADGTDHNAGACKGGDPYGAFKWFTEHGLVTGSNYGNEGCKPYINPPDVPHCTTHCENADYTISYEADHHFGLLYDKLSADEGSIMKEIYEYGPVAAAMYVSQSFGHANIETCASHRKAEHAIRIIGWGEEQGVKYWLCANSWGENWANKGYFKIRRGTNECHIEDEVTFVRPKINF